LFDGDVDLFSFLGYMSEIRTWGQMLLLLGQENHVFDLLFTKVETVDKAANPDTVCKSNNNTGLYAIAFLFSSFVYSDSDVTI
jgi:hypothetical protein